MLISNRFFTVFRTAARGLEAQRIALSTATENIANASTSRTADDEAYAIKRAIHEAPAERTRRFSDLLSAMTSSLHGSDPRHLEGTSLRRRATGVDMGPLTEVQQQLVLRTEYDPTHPHADEAGYVQYPDINVVEEMARMISANRLYEANLSAVQAAKEMIKRTLEL
jgi:flagellar basal-body rod protein FlgC